MPQISLGTALMNNCSVGALQVQRVSLGTTQIWAHEVVVVLGNATGVVLRNLFTEAVWTSDTPKRVVVPAGVEIGAVGNSHAIATTSTGLGQAGSFGGTLILEVRGIVSGIGGAPNSGKGGDVIWANFPGKNGQKLIINLYGTLRAGGGGGGRGGTGGQGYTQNYQDSGWRFQQGVNHMATTWSIRVDEIFWDGVKILNNQPFTGNDLTQYFDIGGWRYFRGSYRHTANGSWEYQEVRRQLITPVTNYHNGGAGGNGGRGQGYDGGNTDGQPGAAGGPNAGTGGRGGWGMHYGGGQANPGGTGGNGNNGAGAAGAAGGLPGFYLNGSANATINNSGGTLQGRIQ